MLDQMFRCLKKGDSLQRNIPDVLKVKETIGSKVMMFPDWITKKFRNVRSFYNQSSFPNFLSVLPVGPIHYIQNLFQNYEEHFGQDYNLMKVVDIDQLFDNERLSKHKTSCKY